MAIDQNALKKLLDLVGGDPEDLAEFIEDFLEIAPTLVADMQAGVTAQDWDKVRIAAHTLKSNAKDLGALDLSDLSKTLEAQCKAGDTDTSGALVDQIAQQSTADTAALAEIDPATI
ncbi:Hpt domain-containing protein [uncultured Tateyamaria sp.]|uniref:Hpt domain-containing protein n=1 Tax=uncultured Tateyamaria sp. TaxID=455651 RepID=UPI00261A2410|nr:Hpt domain-containing protein [uncultured Tateyamaria sp.]